MGHGAVFLSFLKGVAVCRMCLLAGFSFLPVRSFVCPLPPPSFEVDKGLGQ
jgi:hypothetical protein